VIEQEFPTKSVSSEPWVDNGGATPSFLPPLTEIFLHNYLKCSPEKQKHTVDLEIKH
jgi:hypothetical protein